MRRYLLALLFTLGLASPAVAQIGSVPFVFEPDTVISSSQVNQNFATVYSNALLRTGGTMTGTLNVQAVLPVADNTYDSGSAALSWNDGWFDGVLTAASMVVSGSGASALDVTGGINAGSGNVDIIGTDGRVPAISSTYFASLSAANLTGVLESSITDSTILARVASPETISGAWTFTNGTTTLANANPFLNWNATGAATDNKVWRAGITGTTWFLSAVEDALVNGNFALTITRSGTTPQLTSIFTALALPSTLTPSALASGNTDDYAPTGHAATYMFRLSGDAGGSTLRGLQGGTAGRKVVLCNITSNTITLADDTGGTAANRFLAVTGLTLGTGISDTPCAEFIYDGTSTRWRPLGRRT